MASIPLVALNQQQQPGPIDQYGKAMQLKQMLDAQKLLPGQQQLQQEQIQGQRLNNQGQEQQNAKAQKDAQDTATIAQIFQEAGDDLGPAVKKAMAINPEKATEIQKKIFEAGDAEIKKQSSLLKYHGEQTDYFGKLLGGVTDQSSWVRTIGKALSDDALTGEQAAQYLAQPYSQELKDKLEKATLDVKSRIEQANKVIEQKEAERHARAQEAATAGNVTPAELALRAAKGDPDAKAAMSEMTKQRIAGRAVSQSDPPASISAVDPESGSILKQTGLSLPAFLAGTGSSSQLPRDKETRNRAFKEFEQFANKRGIDSSTIASQYKSYNEVLGKNISRLNNTKIMESELQGTIKNLEGVVQQKDLGSLNFANIARIWAGQQVNDSLAQQYAVHLSQLRNELAAYYAATQGRDGGDINLSDQRDAEGVIRNGISTGSLEGLQKAVGNSTEKMGTVMNASVDRSRKAIWDLFGVGNNYNPTGGAGAGGGQASNAAPPQPQGATHIGVGSVDKKKHYLDANNKDLGLAE